MYEVNAITKDGIDKILAIDENYLVDLKDKRISAAKLSESVSAFANSSGGDIYVGISEKKEADKRVRTWNGFLATEDANGFIQMLESLAPLQNFFNISFLQHPLDKTYILQVTVFKTKDIIRSTKGETFIRCGGQKLKVDTPEKMRRLELDKGLSSFEDEKITESYIDDAVDSNAMTIFCKNSLNTNVDVVSWLHKQRLIKDNSLTLAGTILFVDEPQVVIPKRSAIKIFRYKTSEGASRDYLDKQPITIEGIAYRQIYDSVEKVNEIIEKIKIADDKFKSIKYPDETLHEIITNAVLHRDYSITTDIQIRIFDNRVEVESPGKLPGLVTEANILNMQAARNPKMVRLINKFPQPPNKDVGEGLNTAFEAMEKLRLKPPIIHEKEASVLVIIKHEKMASPEQTIVEYLRRNNQIRNKIGREITGIKSENTMKRVFYKLKDMGFIQLKGHMTWIKTDRFDKLAKDQFTDNDKGK